MLVTSTPGVGHVGALAPVALALRDRGHDLHWAIGPDGGVAVGEMGFDWSPAGISPGRRRELAADALGEVMRRPMAERRGPLFAALFARAAGPVMQRELTPIIDRVRPDVVVREVSELAAAPMAAARGIPLVTVAFSGVLPELARPAVVDALGPLWDAEGLAQPSWDALYGDLYLHPFPESFGQRPESSVVRPIRRDRGVPSAAPAPWVEALGVERPLVYATSGTEVAATSFPWRELLGALGASDVDAVATVGPHVDPAGLGTVPANVRIERFVPQADLLTRAAAVVSHGGAGSVLGAAAHGRPQAAVPLFADQWENGVAIAEAGCGLLLEPGRRSVDDLEEALRALLAGSELGAAAERVEQEIAAMPTVDDIVPEIEALAGT